MAIYSGNNLVATKGGVSNYPDLDNKPQINNVILTGNKTAEDLGLQAAGDYALKSEIPEEYVLPTASNTVLGGVKLDNDTITSVDGTISFNINNKITNCITKIPQDIKLELTDGTLTLKAGSVYYKCDGNFTKTTLEQDISVTNIGDGIRFVSVLDNTLNLHLISGISSGSIQPSSGTKWFNTTNNIMYNSTDNGANWTELPDFSLPLAIITVKNNTITSIDQVFNGFGYMGNAVFTLPGIEGLCPNGRNTDGSLKNVIDTYTEVNLINLSNVNNATIVSWLNTQTSNFGTVAKSQYFIQNNEPNNILWSCWFNPNKNIIYVGDGNTWQQRNIFIAFEAEILNSRIISLTPKTTFQAIDYNEYSKDITEIKENVSDKVSLTKNEEIAGTKTFTDNITAPNQIDYTRITNYITKMPQDIKLELNDDILTLKAGSKVYIPNGKDTSGKNLFNEVILSEDKTLSTANFFDGQAFIALSSNNNLDTAPQALIKWESTDGQPTDNDHNRAYDYTNNKIWYRTATDTWEDRINEYSLPLAIITIENNTIASIDQVFNGFGYMGSTIFALPGVEGLIPNGFNEDGSLNNIKYTTPTILTRTDTTLSRDCVFTIATTGIGIDTNIYKSDENYIYSGLNLRQRDRYIAGKIIYKNGQITSFEPKASFHAVDYNEYEYLVSSVPSSVYQKMKDITNTTVSLVDGISIYKLNNITSAMTVSFVRTALSNLSVDRVITFELYVPVVNTVPTITWPLGLTWLNNEVPTFEANTNYLFAFRSFDQGSTWIGNIQCSWPSA